MPIYTPGTATYNNPIRYIRDSVNGSSANSSSHWVEIQALNSDGTNVAKGKTATLISGTTEGQAISRLTDGDTATANYFGATGTNPTIQIDLGAIYDIASVKVWHYYSDGRTYKNPITQVSSDGSTWITISDGTTYKETSSGKTWSCDKIDSQQILVNYEIGKLYDYDGTTSYQIGKIYDWDGTSSSLIYSSNSDPITLTCSVQQSGSYDNLNYANKDYSVTEDWSKMIVTSSSRGVSYGQFKTYLQKIRGSTTTQLAYKGGAYTGYSDSVARATICNNGTEFTDIKAGDIIRLRVGASYDSNVSGSGTTTSTITFYFI